MQQETAPIAEHTSLKLPAKVPPCHTAWLPLGLVLAMLLHLFGASVLLWAAQFVSYTEPPRLITLLLRGGGGNGENEGNGGAEKKGGSKEHAGNEERRSGENSDGQSHNSLVAASRVTPESTAEAMPDQATIKPAPTIDSNVTPSPKTAPPARTSPKHQNVSKSGAVSATTTPAPSPANLTPDAALSGIAKTSDSKSPNGNASGLFGKNGSDSDSATGNGSQSGTGIGNGEGGAPSLAQFTRPAYPRRSRQAGEEGAVLLEALVSPQGALLEVRVVQSSGYPRLDEAARASLHKARFVPAMRQGRPVAGRLMVPFTFSLQDDA